MELILTRAEIKEDISGFQARLQEANNGLSSLPYTAGTWVDRKKLRVQRDLLQKDVKHFTTLIKIAREGLADCVE